MIRPLVLSLLSAALLCGCGTGYRSCSQASLVSVRSPIFVANGVTNSMPGKLVAGASRADSQSAALTLPVNSKAPIQIYAEQVLVMFFGGSAASNEVLSNITLPLKP